MMNRAAVLSLTSHPTTCFYGILFISFLLFSVTSQNYTGKFYVLNPINYSIYVISNNFLHNMKTTTTHEYKTDIYT